MLSRETLIVGCVVLGVIAGGLSAFLTTRRAKNFRKRLLSEFDDRMKSGAAAGYASQIISQRAKWKKSVSLIRKPFSKHVNLAIETAALIYAGTGLINSLVRFDTVFDSPLKGMGIIMFLSMIMAYIPFEWLFSGQIDKEMDSVLQEMETAMKRDRLELYIAEAKKNWT